MTDDPVSRSLEIAAERCEDLSPAVYARLFAEMPELRSLFRKEPRLVQGEMLARALETILDFCGDRLYGPNMVLSESINHEAYAMPPDAFARFFGVIRHCVRDVVGADWTAQMEEGWTALLADIATHVDARADA
jgi:hemoglobin-like flavoprotein